MPNITIDYFAIGLKTALSIAGGVIGWLAYRAIAQILKQRIKDQYYMHMLRTLTRSALFLASGVVILLIWLGASSNFSVAMGIFGAGVAFASQEVIGSFAGYINIISSSIYRIGDRVHIGDVIGDVIDISILRTTVMEIGEWVKADQYTGRVVTIANNTVFSAPVYNYTQHWGYLWDEITLPVTYSSDWRRAAELMHEHGQEYSEALQADAYAGLSKMSKRYPLQQTQVEPTIYLTMTDNWVEITLRYIVRARERRNVKAQLHRELLQHFEEIENITIASTTMEIVGFPPLQGNSKGFQ
jgi:small-conductance mechanosensitive channel